MNRIFVVVMVFISGVSLGLIFFGGLWWTIKNGSLSKKQPIWFTGSLLIRFSVILLGFYFVGNSRLDSLLICLSGFIAARFITTRFIVKKFTELPVKANNP